MAHSYKLPTYREHWCKGDTRKWDVPTLAAALTTLREPGTNSPRLLLNGARLQNPTHEQLQVALENGELEDADLVNWLVLIRNHQQHRVGGASEAELAEACEALTAFTTHAKCLPDDSRVELREEMEQITRASSDRLLSYLRSLPHHRQLGVLEGYLMLPNQTRADATGFCTSALDKLVSSVEAGSVKVVHLVGACGSGKSAMLSRLVSTLSGRDDLVVAAHFCSRADSLLTAVKSVILELGSHSAGFCIGALMSCSPGPLRCRSAPIDAANCLPVRQKRVSATRTPSLWAIAYNLSIASARLPGK